MQPRITPSLPTDREGFAIPEDVFRAPAAMDPYASAVSDVYQDLFREGSYTGKGIYDVDAFETALEGKVAENTLLSHDLFEGIFARAALATDIELFDEFPSHYETEPRRASTAGRAETGSFCPGFSATGACRRPDAANVSDSRDQPLEDDRQSAAHAFGALSCF